MCSHYYTRARVRVCQDVLHHPRPHRIRPDVACYILKVLPLPEDVVIVAPLPQPGVTVAGRLLEVLNKADQGCVVTSGYEEVNVIRHEAVRNDVKPVA